MAEFAARTRDLQNLQQSLKARSEKLVKDAATMTEDQRNREDKEITEGQRELQRKGTELQDDENTRKNDVLSALQNPWRRKSRPSPRPRTTI